MSPSSSAKGQVKGRRALTTRSRSSAPQSITQALPSPILDGARTLINAVSELRNGDLGEATQRALKTVRGSLAENWPATIAAGLTMGAGLSGLSRENIREGLSHLLKLAALRALSQIESEAFNSRSTARAV